MIQIEGWIGDLASNTTIVKVVKVTTVAEGLNTRTEYSITINKAYLDYSDELRVAVFEKLKSNNLVSSLDEVVSIIV